VIDTFLQSLLVWAAAAGGVALGYWLGWASGRYRLLSGADPATDQRRCSILTCGNSARADTGLCEWHTIARGRRRGRLGVEPHPTPNRRRKGAA